MMSDFVIAIVGIGLTAFIAWCMHVYLGEDFDED